MRKGAGPRARRVREPFTTLSRFLPRPSSADRLTHRGTRFMRHAKRVGTTLGMLLLPLLAACAGGASDSTTSPTQPQAQVGAVQGKVMDGAGAAVSGAGLSLTAAGRSGLSTTSGSDGAYSFAQVPAGS